MHEHPTSTFAPFRSANPAPCDTTLYPHPRAHHAFYRAAAVRRHDGGEHDTGKLAALIAADGGRHHGRYTQQQALQHLWRHQRAVHEGVAHAASMHGP
eukprot:352972-Chlamydomonas_euryale.AAC.8